MNHPERQKAEAGRNVRIDAAVGAALADWQALRDRHGPAAAVLAVLDLHRPERGYKAADCAHCEQHDGMESTENVPWPCATFAAVRQAGAGPEIPERLPAPGDVLHIHETGRDHCLPGTVIDTAGRCGVYLDIGLVGGDNRYSSHIHDESRTIDGSWHWPCEGDRAPLADPRPAPAATVTVHIDGAELFRIMTTQALRQGRRNPR